MIQDEVVGGGREKSVSEGEKEIETLIKLESAGTWSNKTAWHRRDSKQGSCGKIIQVHLLIHSTTTRKTFPLRAKPQPRRRRSSSSKFQWYPPCQLFTHVCLHLPYYSYYVFKLCWFRNNSNIWNNSFTRFTSWSYLLKSLPLRTIRCSITSGIRSS